jgi:hypothetical protein
MKPTEIETRTDKRLYVQTVKPYIEEGKARTLCPEEFCLLIEGELSTGDDRIEEFSETVLIDKEGAEQLMEELKKFIERAK